MHVISTFYPRQGGMGVVVFDEAKELAKRGHNVRVVTMRYGGEYKREEKDGFMIERIQPLLRMGDGAVTWFGNALKEADIVHVHLPWYGSAFLAYLFLRNYKKPYVVTLHMEGQLTGLRKIFKIFGEKLFLKTILKHAKKVFVVNKNYFDKSEYLKNLPNNKVVELPNPIDTYLFSPGVKDSLVLNGLTGEGSRVMLFVGNLMPVKRLDMLLRVLARGESSWRLGVVGGGYAEAEYKRIASDLKIEDKVVFFGSVEREKLPAFYRASDCVVVPSESESFSLVALESMACGTPVIISAVPGASQRIQEGAIGFKPGDENDLLVQLKKVLAIDAPKKQIEREAILKYSLERHVENLEKIYLQ